MNTDLSNKREELEKLVTELSGLAMQDLDQDGEKRFSDLEGHADQLRNEIAKLERVEKAKAFGSNKEEKRSSTLVVKGRKANNKDMSNAFRAWCLGGSAQTKGKIKDEWKRSCDLLELDYNSKVWECRAQSTDTSGEGEEMLADNVHRGIIEARAFVSALYNECNVITVDSADTLKFAIDDDLSNVAKKHDDQNEAIANVNIGGIDALTVSPKIYSTSVFPVSIQMLRDVDGIEAYIGRKLARRLFKKVNLDLTATLVAGSALGTTGLSNELNHNDLGDLYFSVDPEFIGGSVWVMNHATAFNIWQNTIDPDAPQLNDSLVNSPVSQILGSRVVLNQAMDTMECSVAKKPIIFGNLREAMTVVQVGQPKLIRYNERYMDQLSVGFSLWNEYGFLYTQPNSDACFHLATGSLSGDCA